MFYMASYVIFYFGEKSDSISINSQKSNKFYILKWLQMILKVFCIEFFFRLSIYLLCVKESITNLNLMEIILLNYFLKNNSFNIYLKSQIPFQEFLQIL